MCVCAAFDLQVSLKIYFCFHYFFVFLYVFFLLVLVFLLLTPREKLCVFSSVVAVSVVLSIVVDVLVVVVDVVVLLVLLLLLSFVAQCIRAELIEHYPSSTLLVNVLLS